MEHAAQDTGLSAQFRNICIFGAGAIGGALAVRLATRLTGTTISAIARGAHLQAIREKGLHLHEHGGSEPLVAKVNATDTAADGDANAHNHADADIIATTGG